MQLSAPTIDDLRQKVRDEHGPSARIVSAEKVIPRGIGRIRKPTYFEAVVELPDAPPSPPDVQVDPAARHGIASLLADAEDAEDADGMLRRTALPSPTGAPHTGPSHTGSPHSGSPHSGSQRTGSPHTGFDELMASLAGFAAPPPPAASALPALLELEAARPSVAVPVLPNVPGDLVAVVSAGQDALAVAQAMCRVSGAGELRAAGGIKVRGRASLTDRRSALLARADGVEAGMVVFCAFGAESSDDALAALGAIDPDQVWVVVDAGRKPDDTQRWVDRVATAVDIAALAVVGAASTATPQTVNSLGIPVGWVDGAPAAAARL
ncbi:hypothetical protein G3T36_04885 [Diaminobutyricibacter tongyongensis]|uniref:Uncharacterized protein n=1 Tax=Leifsonia tongyongensis TaxID=1268043 RepID=A0A6L9XUV7_9MICO|nr:hypothetical protein [Diaminobutyricibacter tongyongensis]NEN05201.1 hypothetical protein [Diaminobutyricibacter tongyongensis]